MGPEEAIAITTTILALTAVLLISKLVLKNRGKPPLKPPSPPSWPIIGHLHLLKKNQPLHRTLLTLSNSYGPVVHLNLGFRPALLISSAKHAKECLTTNDRAFASRPNLLAGIHMGYNSKVLPWLPYGSYWRDLRKICTLHLFSVHRIESLRHIRVQEVSRLVASLFQAVSRRDGHTGNMKSLLSQLTFDVILRMVAGMRSADSEDAKRFRGLMEETFLLAGSLNLGDYLPFLRWFDVQGLRKAMVDLQKKRDEFMQMLVDEHRGSRRDCEDLIDVLISTTEGNENLAGDNDTVVKASAVGMITAGTDTSASTIEWALAALLQHPHILRKAQQELDIHIGQERIIDESDLHKLPYLQAIVKETFRLYPAGAVLIPHESTEACSIGGFHVPSGTRLLVNVWAIQRDPAVWEQPLKFDPERFLKSGQEIDVKGQHFELIPFGSGRRMCPGMSLALCLVSYTLARLLQSFEWSVPQGSVIEMKEGLGLTMPKAIPLEAIIKPRLPVHLY